MAPTFQPMNAATHIPLSALLDDAEEVPSCISPYRIFKFKELPSTNTFLLTHADHAAPYTVVWAESQTHGRGRFTRHWYMEPGNDLAFSVILPLNKKLTSCTPNIPQLAALALCEVLQKFQVTPLIKWPNDVLVNGAKVAGLLSETSLSKTGSIVVLGIGLNVNSHPEKIPGLLWPPTSLLRECKQELDLNPLLQDWLACFHKMFIEWSHQGFQPFLDSLNENLAFKNKNISVKDGDLIHRGQLQGINSDGQLCLILNNGDTEILVSGEISFLGE